MVHVHFDLSYPLRFIAEVDDPVKVPHVTVALESWSAILPNIDEAIEVVLDYYTPGRGWLNRQQGLNGGSE